MSLFLYQGLKETGTQWLGGLGRTLGNGGSLQFGPGIVLISLRLKSNVGLDKLEFQF